MKIQFVFATPNNMPKYAELGEKVSPPLGILYLAAYLREKISGLELNAINGPRKGYEYTLKKIKEFNPEVLCVSYYSVSALGAYKLIDEMKEFNPNLIVIVGGHHVTALPGESFEKSKTDLEVYSEGEVTLTEVIQEYKNKKDFKKVDFSKILGIGYIEEGQVKITNQRPYIEDLNSMPYPARDLIDMTEYDGWHISKQNPQARVIISRGCPYRCTFCSNKVWNRPGSKVRVRSPKNVADEFELLKNDYGIKEIFDDGDELNNNIQNSIEICNEIKRRNLGITWKCQLRSSNLPEELVKAMAESSCWYVHLGIESGNQETLNGIKKGITLKQVEDACTLLAKYNIKVLGLFMLFNAWEENGVLKFEGVKETNNTLKYAKKLLKEKKISYISSSHTNPFPGSELYNIAIRHNLIRKNLIGNWDGWIRDDMYIMDLPGITEKEMARMRTKGNLIIAYQLFKTRDIHFKDFIFFFKKGLKLISDNTKALLNNFRSY